jgi:hypothetical protein
MTAAGSRAVAAPGPAAAAGRLGGTLGARIHAPWHQGADPHRARHVAGPAGLATLIVATETIDTVAAHALQGRRTGRALRPLDRAVVHVAEKSGLAVGGLGAGRSARGPHADPGGAAARRSGATGACPIAGAGRQLDRAGAAARDTFAADGVFATRTRAVAGAVEPAGRDIGLFTMPARILAGGNRRADPEAPGQVAGLARGRARAATTDPLRTGARGTLIVLVAGFSGHHQRGIGHSSVRFAPPVRGRGIGVGRDPGAARARSTTFTLAGDRGRRVAVVNRQRRVAVKTGRCRQIHTARQNDNQPKRPTPGEHATS